MATRGTSEQVLIALTQFTSRQIADLAVDTTESLHDATPKDTGWAAANWIPSIGSPAITNAGRLSNPTPRDAAAARRQQLSVLSRFKSYNVRSGKDLVVTNNVPYISLLNAGTSQQAPSAFVQKAIAGALARANRKKGS